jgi:adenylylsulfate kinase-like enzyme
MFVSGYNTITRWHIRNERFYAYSSEWDGDWEAGNLNQNLAIYEEDNRNQVKITGSVATTVKDASGNQVVATVGFEKTFKSDDELMRQQNLNQVSLFALNRIDLEGESFGDWPVRDRSSQVSFTLQHRAFIP